MIAKVFEAAGLSVLEQVTETMLLRTPHRVPMTELLVIEAVGPRYEQTSYSRIFPVLPAYLHYAYPVNEFTQYSGVFAFNNPIRVSIASSGESPVTIPATDTGGRADSNQHNRKGMVGAGSGLKGTGVKYETSVKHILLL